MGLFKFGLILDSARIIAAFERKSKAHSFEDEPAQQWRQAETGSKVWGRQIEMDHPRFQFLNGKEGRERDGERETFKVPHCLKRTLTGRKSNSDAHSKGCRTLFLLPTHLLLLQAFPLISSLL